MWPIHTQISHGANIHSRAELWAAETITSQLAIVLLSRDLGSSAESVSFVRVLTLMKTVKFHSFEHVL